MSDETISLKEAVEQRLAAQLASDPSARDQLASDPDSVVKPIMAELLGDDGDVDLSSVKTNVHIESGDELHFVVAPDAVVFDEVSGFAMDQLSMSGLIGNIDISTSEIGDSSSFIKKRTKGGRCTNSGHRGTKCCYLD